MHTSKALALNATRAFVDWAKELRWIMLLGLVTDQAAGSFVGCRTLRTGKSWSIWGRLLAALIPEHFRVFNVVAGVVAGQSSKNCVDLRRGILKSE